MNPTKFPWLDTTEYPFRPNYIEINQQSVHYVDEGQGETLLFVHGTPSWSFDFRNLIKPLAQQYRCVAPDHVGFGLSAKPRHYDYTTQTHAKIVGQFIEALQLRDITLVVHDFGGPIGFANAISQPGRIKRIVVLNSWLWSSESEPAFQKLRNVLKNPLLPFLYRYANLSPRCLLPASFGNKASLSRAVHQHYIRPFASPSERSGPLAFARSLLHDQAWFETLWLRRQVVAQKPMLLIWGMKDPFLTPDYLTKFQRGFPQAQTVTLPSCGHFPQEEESQAVAQAIAAFLKQSVGETNPTVRLPLR